MIPEAAVEAAARILYPLSPLDSDAPDDAEDGLARTRAALEAAAPHIEKDAYERGWGAGFRHTLAAMKRAAK